MRNYILLIFILGLNNLCAQGLLKGAVMDDKKQALPLVTVAIFSLSDSTLVAGTVTDSLGNYKISVIEGGYFIRYSLIGYDNEIINFSIQNSITKTHDVILSESSLLLDDVTITASRTPFSLSNGALIVNVEHSILKNEVRTFDLLKKIPGVISQGNALEVFGRGSPAYYINEKEVLDFSDILNLSVDDIRSIKLITSPDVRYTSDRRAVILIKTRKRRDGLTYSINLNGIRGKKNSHNETFNINYQNKGIHLFGIYKYADSRAFESEYSNQTITTDTLWTTIKETSNKKQIKEHYYQTGIDYEINEKNEFGLKYTGKISDSKIWNNSRSRVNADNIHFADISSLNHTTPKNDSHHINIYFNSKINEKWGINLYSDYIKKKTTQNGIINELDSKTGIENISYKAKSLWDVFAINAQIYYNTENYGDFTLGYNSGIVDGYDLIDNVRVLHNGKTENREDKHSVYLMHVIEKGDFSINTGIRYEYLKSKLDDKFSGAGSTQKTYNNIFPSISLSHNFNVFSHTLSYSMRIDRPEFSSLNNNITYIDRFNSQMGNINLKPAIIQDLNYSLFYKFIFLNLNYTRTKDQISTGFQSSSTSSSILISYPENFKNVHDIIGMINLQHSFKWWEPSLTATCMKSFFKHNGINNNIVRAKKPITFINISNGFTLPKDFFISLGYTYSFGGDLMMIDMESYSNIDIRLQKQFFKGKLQASIDSYDIFNKNKTKCTTRLNNVNMYISRKDDSRKIGFTLVYRFKNPKKEYSGATAAQEQLDRLRLEE